MLQTLSVAAQRFFPAASSESPQNRAARAEKSVSVSASSRGSFPRRDRPTASASTGDTRFTGRPARWGNSCPEHAKRAPHRRRRATRFPPECRADTPQGRLSEASFAAHRRAPHPACSRLITEAPAPFQYARSYPTPYTALCAAQEAAKAFASAQAAQMPSIPLPAQNQGNPSLLFAYISSKQLASRVSVCRIPVLPCGSKHADLFLGEHQAKPGGPYVAVLHLPLRQFPRGRRRR